MDAFLRMHTGSLLARKLAVRQVADSTDSPQGAVGAGENRKATGTFSPSLGSRVVWLQEKPNLSELAISCLIKVPLPTPDGPQITMALGNVCVVCMTFGVAVTS